jgi:pimeloyl-ACP methyl ester carboxylesterase
MVRTRELSVETDPGVRLALLRSLAPAQPAVVALHGLLGTRESVIARGELHRAGLGLLAYDARGHGRSTSPLDRGAYGYAAMTSDLEAAMDAAGVERAILVGISIGGLVALRMARLHPERVAALAVVTPAYDPTAPLSEAALERARRVARALVDNDPDAFLAAEPIRTPGEGRTPSPRGSAAALLARHADRSAVADALMAMLGDRPFESLAELGELDVPSVVVGSRDEFDPLHPLTIARRYAAALPGARFVCEPSGELPLSWRRRALARLAIELAARAGAPFDAVRPRLGASST